MNDIREQIQPGEEIVYVAHPSRIRMIPLLLLAVIVAVVTVVVWRETDLFAVLIIGLALVLLAMIRVLAFLVVIRFNTYAVTNKRIIKQTGILDKASVDTYLDKINNVEHRETFWGRIWKYGDVEIDTASETGMTRFLNISHPIDFKNAIVSSAEKYRSMRGGGVVVAPSGADRLRDLKRLLDDGLISQEEFAAKRAKMVDEL